MKKSTYSKLTDDELLKKIDFMKSAIIAFTILYFIIVVVLLYLFFNKQFGDTSMAALIPIFFLPVTLLPMTLSYKMLLAEKKTRNL